MSLTDQEMIDETIAVIGVDPTKPQHEIGRTGLKYDPDMINFGNFITHDGRLTPANQIALQNVITFNMERSIEKVFMERRDLENVKIHSFRLGDPYKSLDGKTHRDAGWLMTSRTARGEE